MVGIKTKIGFKGQVVIPKPLRDEFNLMPEDTVVFDQTKDSITIKKAEKKDPIEIFKEIKKKATKKFTLEDYKKINWDELYKSQMEERLRLK